ncbi:hypothetical protein XELAEV_18029213mg [Xenopus laevis]|uniref:Uncharacterized protein n=1 Tax=Xenopus laevis TaxID=8355 RepID=A0A974HHE4_XENLA|nr:hypothetical protein XELAEV_18029213mg [Xenopus laevis]
MCMCVTGQVKDTWQGAWGSVLWPHHSRLDAVWGITLAPRLCILARTIHLYSQCTAMISVCLSIYYLACLRLSHSCCEFMHSTATCSQYKRSWHVHKYCIAALYFHSMSTVIDYTGTLQSNSLE